MIIIFYLYQYFQLLEDRIPFHEDDCSLKMQCIYRPQHLCRKPSWHSHTFLCLYRELSESTHRNYLELFTPLVDAGIILWTSD